MEKLREIIENQKEFQRLVGFPIDSILEKERNELSEKFIFKLIEEAVELRKEFPSVVNPWSKSQKNADLTRVKEELSDVILFLVNIINVWKFTETELVETLLKVQTNNFRGVKQKKMDMLNSDILKIPGRVSGIGHGNLTPKYVFAGQNPSEGITQGYKFWSDPSDGSSKILLPVLEELGILGDSYFTNVVKCVTSGNSDPTQEMTDFYKEFLTKELEILRYNNPEMKVISMGNWTDMAIFGLADIKIPHPATCLYGNITIQEYSGLVRNLLKLS